MGEAPRCGGGTDSQSEPIRYVRRSDVEVLDRELLGEYASHDIDRLQIVMDIETTGTSGYRGRVSGEQVTPYPPGVPGVVPGEELNDAVIACLRSGADAGMTVPDPSDPKMHHFRVVT
ncbi:MAG: decarboxylase [Mycobacterium sp.]|nr:decarboxylase [Mycobacterium sp.]